MSEPVDRAAKPDELLDEAGEQAGLTSDDAGQAAPADAGAASGTAPGSDEQIAQLKALAAERTEDLPRVHAEYVNYKERVDRDRALARQGGIEALLRDLLPVFDSITAAEKQGEANGLRLHAGRTVRGHQGVWTRVVRCSGRRVRPAAARSPDAGARPERHRDGRA